MTGMRRSAPRPIAALTVLVSAALLATAAAGTSASTMLAVGDRFPAWTLVDQTGAVLSSRDLAGKRYLLWFYPKAMTPGCTAEGNGLRDNFPALHAAGVEILGVSFDAPGDNAAFVKAQDFPFRLLSDRQRALAVAVGAADSIAQPVARRISYLIGPDGSVLRAYDAVDPAAHARQVLADVEAGAAVAAVAASAPARPTMPEEERKEFLARPLVARLATVGANGSPHVTPMWFLYEDGIMYMSTRADAAKVRHVRANPRVAVVVDVMEAPFKNKIVTIEGSAQVVTTGVQDMTARIRAKYVGAAAAAKHGAGDAERVILAITPKRIVSVDTTR
jgi:peroxiredoxin Q/BCP